jgi:hypothetical protein
MKYLSTLFLLLIVIFSFAQDRDLPEVDENFEKYLDDGQKTGADGNVQLAVSSLIAGFLDVQYEQKINHSLSVQAGGAIQVGSGYDLISLLMDDLGGVEASRFDGGYGYSASVKYYAGQSAITRLGYASLTFRNRTSNYAEGDLTSWNASAFKHTKNDIYYSTGLKFLFANTASADVSTGFGMRLSNITYEDKNIDSENSLGFIYAIEVKLGYYIKY